MTLLPLPRFADVMAHAGSSSLSAVADLSDRIRMDDAANIQFTSGTTGNPKVQLVQQVLSEFAK